MPAKCHILVTSQRLGAKTDHRRWLHSPVGKGWRDVVDTPFDQSYAGRAIQIKAADGSLLGKAAVRGTADSPSTNCQWAEMEVSAELLSALRKDGWLPWEVGFSAHLAE